MDGMRISQLAERIGVATSTLRYYERIGLVPGPGRTASGYRVYGGDAEARLLFITRGKRLGLSLEEIAELVTIWDGTHCGATQDRLSALLDAKRAEIAEQIRELERFADQLADVQGHLSALPGSEGCAPDLACCAPALPDTPVAVSLSSGNPNGRAVTAEEPVVVACTLIPGERLERAAEFAALSDHVAAWARDDTSLRLRFPARDDFEVQIRELMAREQVCCAFLLFTLRRSDGELCWDIEAPDAATALALDEFLPLLAPARESRPR
jgi:DNA-binding transcriptional MerR regulator